MAEPDPLLDGLRSVASTHDRAAPPVGAAEAMASAARAGRRSPGPLTDRRPLLALTAAFVAIVGVVAWLVVERPGDDDGAVVSPGPIPTVDGAPAQTTSTSTSTLAPSAFEPPIAFADLPDAGFAVESASGAITLFGFDGQPIATRAPLEEPNNGPAFTVTQDPDLAPALDDGAEVPDGCAAAAAGGGVRVALCGLEDGQPRRIDDIGHDGSAATIIGTPPDPAAPRVSGHWRWALVSPDGRWMLAQWSGECELPTGFLLAADGSSELRTVSGETGGGWLGAPMSRALGWTPDGRAVVEIQNSGCSSPTDAPGTYLLDPVTGERQLLRPATDDRERAFAWSSDRGLRTTAERLLSGAIDGLGLERCCDEPAHDGSSATLGAVFEGYDIAISGGPTAAETFLPATGGQRFPLLSGEALLAPADPGAPASVFFTCGDFTWELSWGDDGTAEVDSMLLLAEALVPYLACTLRDPPAPASGG